MNASRLEEMSFDGKREADEAQRTRVQRELDRLVDDAGHDSFPASDAPAWWSSPPKIAT